MTHFKKIILVSSFAKDEWNMKYALIWLKHFNQVSVCYIFHSSLANKLTGFYVFY